MTIDEVITCLTLNYYKQVGGILMDDDKKVNDPAAPA